MRTALQLRQHPWLKRYPLLALWARKCIAATHFRKFESFVASQSKCDLGP